MSINQPQTETKENSKEIYFLIFFKEKINSEEIKFQNNESIEFIFLNDENISEKEFKLIVFKQKIENDKKRKEITIDFNLNDDKYIINFVILKESFFVFDLNLKVHDGFYQRDKDIPQNGLEYFDKIKIFIKSLKQNKEEKKIPLLYYDAINLYSENPNFSFLIKLFIKTYENKDLCLLLLKKFVSTINNKKQMNSIIEEDLKIFKEDIFTISEEAENLITNFSYEPINFYGLILCYFNNYDYENFISLFNILYNNHKEILFQILIIFESYFKCKIKCEFNFFDDFINYSISKKFNEFVNNCLIYLKDINLYLKVLEKNKEKIITIKNFHPLKIIDIDKNTKLNIKEIIDLIEKIISFSENEKKLLIFFTNEFWKNIIVNYSTATKENITICFKLRNLFERYYNLVIKNEKKENEIIYSEATELHNIEYYGSLLDKIILNFIEIEKNIDNDDIISLITSYDIYYADNKTNDENEDKYINKRSLDIFNKFNFEQVEDDFIIKFKKCNFELKFKNQIDGFLLKIFDKIKNIEGLNNIIKLINTDNLKNKKIDYLNLLYDKYDLLNINESINETEKEQEKKIEKIIDSLAFMTNFLYKFENNFKFISDKIGNLNKKIRYKIYIRLIEENDVHSKLIEYIKDLYLKNLNEENIEYFLEFIKKLKITKKDDYISLMNKIADNYIIETADFFFLKQI